MWAIIFVVILCEQEVNNIIKFADLSRDERARLNWWTKTWIVGFSFKNYGVTYLHMIWFRIVTGLNMTKVVTFTCVGFSLKLDLYNKIVFASFLFVFYFTLVRNVELWNRKKHIHVNIQLIVVKDVI